ncbi:Cys-tRNA(Pro)/Cys-tRNA(Cys) deacylase YbaK [compost metagenome]
MFVIPVAEELDLKKAAKAAGEKKIEMLPMKDLLKWTGYIRGGCSPVGMKKLYPTYIEYTAELFDTIAVSAGKIGMQMELNPQELAEMTGAVFSELTK